MRDPKRQTSYASAAILSGFQQRFHDRTDGHELCKITWLKEMHVSDRGVLIGENLRWPRGRRCNKKHFCVPAPSGGSNVAKHFIATFPRKIAIQQNDIRTWGVVVGIGRIQEGDGGFSIVSDMNAGADVSRRKRFPNKKDVRGVVLDNEDMGRLQHGTVRRFRRTCQGASRLGREEVTISGLSS
jgi:hypothetical protein